MRDRRGHDGVRAQTVTLVTKAAQPCPVMVNHVTGHVCLPRDAAARCKPQAAIAAPPTAMRMHT